MSFLITVTILSTLSCYTYRPSLSKTWSTWQYRFHVEWATWHGERSFTKTWLPETVCKCVMYSHYLPSFTFCRLCRSIQLH